LISAPHPANVIPITATLTPVAGWSLRLQAESASFPAQFAVKMSQSAAAFMGYWASKTHLLTMPVHSSATPTAQSVTPTHSAAAPTYSFLTPISLLATFADSLVTPTDELTMATA
jgi:hypothetical protein